MKNITTLKSVLSLSLASLIFTSHADTNKISLALDEIEQEKLVTNIYRAYFPNQDIARKASITFHSQILESSLNDGYLILELSEEDKSKLKTFGFRFKPADNYIAARNQRLATIQQSLATQSTLSSDFTVQTIPGYACYETVEETFSAAEEMVTNHPNLAQFIDVGDSWEKTQNLGGYDIQVLKLTNSGTTGTKPILFINSAIHAREYTTAPLNLEFARWLVDGYGNDADATWILDHHEVHLMLQTNPDGRKKAETGLSWRKNTNQNYCGATSNSRGADLNRNFSFKWNSTNGQGSSGSQCSNTYRGPSAGSEPEIQALESYVKSIFADNRGPNNSDAAPADTSGIHIDIHSYSELVLWPWGDSSQVAPNGVAMQTLGRKFAYFNGYTPQQSIGLYPTDGTSDNISYGELGVAAFTFELGTSFFQACSTYENTIVTDNLPALIYAAKVVRLPYITPGGPDISSLTINGTSSSGNIAPGATGTIAATSTDTRFSSANGTEATQNISSGEYYIDTPPWVSGATAIPLSASDGNFNSSTEGLTGTIDTTGLSVGQHIVYVRSKDASNTWGAVSAIFLQVTDDVPPPADNVLENGVAKTGLSASTGEELLFTMAVPQNATNIAFNISGGTGDADLYVKFGSVPTDSSYDCRPYRNGNVETCTATQVNGTYHVRLKAYSTFSGVSLTGSYTEGGTPPNNDPIDRTETIASLSQGQWARYTQVLPAGYSDLNVSISGGTGDADLYVRKGAASTTSAYDCRPYRNGNVENCSFTNPGADTWYIDVRGYRASSNVTLSITATPSN